MEQLKMRWTNDRKPAPELNIPDGCEIKRFTELDGALDAWLDIVQYGLSDGRKDADFYGSLMLDWPDYSEDKNFFIVSDGEPAATLTVVCHPENMEGYIHMVACKEKFRGRGFGTLLNNLALKVLKDEGLSFLPRMRNWFCPFISAMSLVTSSFSQISGAYITY